MSTEAVPFPNPEQDQKSPRGSVDNTKEVATNAGNKRKHESQTSTEPPTKMPKTLAPPHHKNSAIFISNLPDYTTIEGLEAEFKKYGLIAESIDDDSLRIKLYYDDEGKFKGEALIVYHRPESVPNAVLMADGAQYDPLQPSPNGPMKVAEAAMAHKAYTTASNNDDDNATARKKTQQAASMRRGKPSLSENKQKALRKKKQFDGRLASWSSDSEDELERSQLSHFDLSVVIKYAFTLKALKEERGFLEDLENDMRDEAVKHGRVKRIRVYDGEADGIVMIRFDTPQAAQSCIREFNGRNYDGRVLEASVAKRGMRFKMMDETERLDRYQKELDENSEH